MEIPLSLNQGLIIWVVAIIVIIRIQRTRTFPSTGLVYAYLVNLWLIHWPGALLYALPWYWNQNIDLVKAGFNQSVYGIVAFTVGVVCVRLFWQSFSRKRSGPLQLSAPELKVADLDRNLPVIYIIVGLISSLVLSRLIGRIPTVSAVVATMGQLTVTGLCLACWQAWRDRNYRAFTRWSLAAFAFPLITIVFQGFLSFGTMALINVLAFIATFVRWRPRTLLTGMLIAYLGLSFYAAYMRDRTAIRMVIWGGQSLQTRVSRVYQTATSLEWFDPWNVEHLRLIDIRLNQNMLVGASVVYLSSGFQEYARGATLQDAAIAIVPRILWPEKPVRAGGNALVTAYTGIPFAAGTSVGIGQVMEFYINFGTTSVIFGFLIFGIFIAFFDLKAAHYLYQGDFQRFTFWFLPGLGFMAAGDSLVVVIASVGAGFLTAFLVNRGIRIWRSHRRSTLRRGGYIAHPRNTGS